MSDLIDRQDAIDMFNRLADDPWNANANTTWSKAYGYAAEMIEELPSAQTDIKAAYEQGRIQGHVEMRTELLMQLKEIVGDEVWKNI